MYRVAILSALLIVVAARRSPNADLVEELQNSPQGARYSNNVIEDSKLDVEGLVKKYGYPFESHSIVTSDGYILEAHRIPHGRINYCGTNRPVVFLMHGLTSSSADYLVLGPGSALGYLLAEEGYDVWLGNARGNYYSRQHLTLDPDDRRQLFWRFSWDEIGNHDLPAFIDYILKTTKQSKLHYVGHSQGCTAFLVLTTLRPEYNDKIISFQGMAPAAFFVNSENEFFHTFAPYESTLLPIASIVGIHEILGRSDLLSYMAVNHCSDDNFLQPLCKTLFINGDNINYFNTTMLPVYLGHYPAGSSIRQVAHYGQSIRDHTFRRFNFGTYQNLLKYGWPNPPHYKLWRVSVPSYIYYSLADRLTDYRDTILLSTKLRNLKHIYEVQRPSFTHGDFVWAFDARIEVYFKVIELLKDAHAKFG